jgi:hypothetical protein
MRHARDLHTLAARTPSVISRESAGSQGDAGFQGRVIVSAAIADRLTSSQVGDFGKETVAAILEARGDAIVALGGSGMPRDGGRQDLDVIAIVDGELGVFEVKARCYGAMAGRTQVDVGLARARLGRARRRADGSTSHAQATREYIIERAEQLIDVDDDTEVSVRLFVVDLKAKLAHEFWIEDGKITVPVSEPLECADFMSIAVGQAFGKDPAAAEIANRIVRTHRPR